MTTSGSTNYSLTGTEVITEALQLIGANGVGSSPSGDDLRSVLRTLNMMIKAWDSEGIGSWKTKEATLFLAYDTSKYSIGPSGDHAAVTSYKTEISTAASSGDSSISVDSDDNFTDEDAVGIELDDGTLQWTTVNGTPSGDSVDLDASLTDSSGLDKHVYNYTTKMPRPVEIIDVRLLKEDDTEMQLGIMSNLDYQALSSKDSLGSPTQVYYRPTLTDATLFVWPTPDDVAERIRITFRPPIEDFDLATDNPDMPQFFYQALAFNLALLIAPKFGKKLDGNFYAMAAGMKESARGYDIEDTSIVFMRDMEWR